MLAEKQQLLLTQRASTILLFRCCQNFFSCLVSLKPNIGSVGAEFANLFDFLHKHPLSMSISCFPYLQPSFSIFLRFAAKRTLNFSSNFIPEEVLYTFHNVLRSPPTYPYRLHSLFAVEAIDHWSFSSFGIKGLPIAVLTLKG